MGSEDHIESPCSPINPRRHPGDPEPGSSAIRLEGVARASIDDAHAVEAPVNRPEALPPGALDLETRALRTAPLSH
jgi:hypothetical protein